MTLPDRSSTMPKKMIGDRAVDGLLAGIAAGGIMALFLVADGWLNRESAATVLGRFDPVTANNLVTGSLTHLAVSAIYGMLFGILIWGLGRIRPSLLRFSWLLGLLYGLVLYAVAQFAFQAGVDSGLKQFMAVLLLLAHAVYGLSLGYILGRKRA